MDAQQFHVAVALGIAAVSAGFDIKSREIPNTVTLGGIVLGLVLNGYLGFRTEGAGLAAKMVGISLLGVFLSAFLPLVFFMRGEMGGGDVKLFGAIGALCGPMIGFRALSFTYIVIVVLILPVRLVVNRKVGLVVTNLRNLVGNVFRSRDTRVALAPLGLPSAIMAPSIFLGLLISTLPIWIRQ